ncbi:inositol 1,4,5-triphosphate receptor associated 1-like isoform X7 [Ruditapes philippinarum]|uniref:inositol 1,4,5-triphosphate receptor associated 1-like isoform X7 n=1 Tax=Ruditapes philippinarum TaxID=129788 RepID=UPI00295BB912|nr:inositol 1,4,5-triphosphate receptor associated 1-like isoform X7 [Ruditapes philippinarum]
MIVQIGSNGMKKNTDVVQTKQPVTNGLDKSQVLVPGEGQDGSGGEHHKYSSNLSKIRENHLAKRRDYIRQNKMPELSELSEKDSPDNNNEEKAETVIKTKDDTPSCEINGDVIMPSIPNEFLQKLGLTQDGKSSEELSDQEIESKFTSLSLAFKTDSQTLEKRLEIQERSRDIAEQNVDKELQGLRIGLETLNQICTDPQVREVLTKIQNHIDILEKSTARVSSRAEVFGAIQQEKRMSKAVDIMVHHVENIRRVHEREHAELEEARKLLQDSRSLAPSTIDLPGGEMLSRRSASVCQNSMFGGKASRRRVSEIALPKVLGGTGAATLHPSASMLSKLGNMHTAHITSESNSLNPNFEADARSRFQAVIASTTVKTAVANTLRRASLEKQNHVQHVTPANTPQVSRDNSSDSPNKHIDVQDKEKQKNLEEEAFKKGYEQGMRASLGQDLSSLREQQNNINESLGEIMDSIDNQIEEPKSLKELLTERFHEAVPKIKISGWRIRMTMGCFFIVMAVLSVIISLFPASSASLIDYRHYGRPPL